LPESGLATSSWLAQILRVRLGDLVEVDLLEAQRRTVCLQVTTPVEDYFGIQAMDSETLAHLMREAPAVNGVNVSLDANEQAQFYDAIKRLPTVSGTVLQGISLANFRKTLAVLVTTMANIYTGLGGGHCLRSGIQQRKDFAFRTCPRAREPPCPWVYTRRDYARPFLRAGAAHNICATTRLGGRVRPGVDDEDPIGGGGDAGSSANSCKAIILHACHEQPTQELMILNAPPLPGDSSSSRPSRTSYEERQLAT